MNPGPRNLITDVPGLLVGNAQDDTLKSGSTVLVFRSNDPFSHAGVDRFSHHLHQAFEALRMILCKTLNYQRNNKQLQNPPRLFR